MANKRVLKQSIHYICGELFAECVAASLYNGTPAQEDIDNILSAIVTMHADYISRISHPEPGIKAKEYYKKMAEEFDKQANEIIDQIGNLS